MAAANRIPGPHPRDGRRGSRSGKSSGAARGCSGRGRELRRSPTGVRSCGWSRLHNFLAAYVHAYKIGYGTHSALLFSFLKGAFHDCSMPGCSKARCSNSSSLASVVPRRLAVYGHGLQLAVQVPREDDVQLRERQQFPGSLDRSGLPQPLAASEGTLDSYSYAVPERRVIYFTDPFYSEYYNSYSGPYGPVHEQGYHFSDALFVSPYFYVAREEPVRPDGDSSLSFDVAASEASVPPEGGSFSVRVRITAPSAAGTKEQGLNLAVVLDTSRSTCSASKTSRSTRSYSRRSGVGRAGRGAAT